MKGKEYKLFLNFWKQLTLVNVQCLRKEEIVLSNRNYKLFTKSYKTLTLNVFFYCLFLGFLQMCGLSLVVELAWRGSVANWALNENIC